MKIKEFFYLLGLKPKSRVYDYVIEEHSIKGYGDIKYARWLHPREKKKEFNVDVINELKKFLSEGDVCVDIGAHTGDTTLPMALAVGADGLVVAFEPNKFVFPSLSATSISNFGRVNILPVMAAASSAYGEMEFEYSDSGFCNGGRHEGISKWHHAHAFKLRVVSVDIEKHLRGMLGGKLTKLKFIKIDTEGYDLYVLLSLVNLIKQVRPYIKVEIYKKTDKKYREQVFSLLDDMGYGMYFADSDECLTGSKIESLDDMMMREHYDIFAIPKAI